MSHFDRKYFLFSLHPTPRIDHDKAKLPYNRAEGFQKQSSVIIESKNYKEKLNDDMREQERRHSKPECVFMSFPPIVVALAYVTCLWV